MWSVERQLCIFICRGNVIPSSWETRKFSFGLKWEGVSEGNIIPGVHEQIDYQSLNSAGYSIRVETGISREGAWKEEWEKLAMPREGLPLGITVTTLGLAFSFKLIWKGLISFLEAALEVAIAFIVASRMFL